MSLEVIDTSFGCNLNKSFSNMCFFRQHLWRYLLDSYKCACNFGITCRVVEKDDTFVDYIGKIEVDFWSASTHVLLKV